MEQIKKHAKRLPHQVAGRQNIQYLKIKHARWLHRAQFLYDIKDKNYFSLYLSTSEDRKFPYVSFIEVSNINILEESISKTLGKYSVMNPILFFKELLSYVREENLINYGKDDIFLDFLENQDWFLWNDIYCKKCDKNGCSGDSTSRFKCHRSAFIIGALDSIETIDIYNLYKKDNENFLSCYKRIEKHKDLNNILKIAHPRWKDAFEELK